VEQPQPDSAVRTELIEVTALLVVKAQLSLEWLKWTAPVLTLERQAVVARTLRTELPTASGTQRMRRCPDRSEARFEISSSENRNGEPISIGEFHFQQCNSFPLQRSAMFQRKWFPRPTYVSLRRSEEKSFGGRAFYKHLAPIGAKRSNILLHF
jgi:hypothetical protein